MSWRSAVAFLVAVTVGQAAPARASDRILRAEITVPAAVDAVWAAWTTEAGIESFLAPAAHVDPRVDGAYEVYFSPSAEPGKRGGEGLRILAFEPPRRLSFTWNAPPTQPYVRAQRTVVTIELAAAGPHETRLRFTHAGWGEGPEWDAAYAYFDDAWSGFVLPMLLERFKSGPVDWKKPPAVAPIARTIRTELVAR